MSGFDLIEGDVTIRKSDGTELGTGTDPVRVDPTGTTAQPVTDAGGSLTVDGPLTDAELRATAVPISAASLPLPAGAATEATLATMLAKADFEARINTQGQKAMAASTPVVIASDQTAVRTRGTDAEGAALTVPPSPVSGLDSGGLVRSLATDADGKLQVSIVALPSVLPHIVNLNYEQSDGAIVASAYKRVISYTIPAGFNGWLIRYSSFQNETSKSRLIEYKEMGTRDFVTNVYVAGASFTAPAFTPDVEAEVTTATSPSGGNFTTVTVTYTNEKGVAGRTGTVQVPKSSVVGARFKLILQTGDHGVRSVQNITDDSSNAGAVKLIGSVHLAYHNDLNNTTQLETNYQPGAISFLAGESLAVEYAGGTVSKDRLFDVLLQLVPA